jgi:GntR family transcriptional regulator, transcriptional repressor for pyruvate dehydrogenase complex
MKHLLKPLKAKSLKEEFIERFEHLILSGMFKIGEKLPSERYLAEHMKISRPVVHEGLVELASKGLITMIPRKGSIVNDYRKEGSIELLTTLINYHEGDIEPQIMNSLLQMRLLFETEVARLAGENRNEDNIKELEAIIDEENKVNTENIEEVADVDFRFHHTVAMVSGNIIYPLMINSFKEIYKNLLRRFFENKEVLETVFDFHKKLVNNIKKGDKQGSGKIMEELLKYSEENLIKQIQKGGLNKSQES